MKSKLPTIHHRRLASTARTVAFALSMFAGSTHAQSTAPATSQRARSIAMLPRGFITVTVGERRAFCEPADQKWVTDALTSAAPATRPTTMPSDLLTRLQEKRELFKGRMASDLAMDDPKVIDKFYDQILLPRVKRLEEFRVPMFYLVCSRPRLKELLRSGDWQDHRFYYNRSADDISFSPDMRLDDESGAPDDMVVPATVNAPTPAEQVATLKRFVSGNETVLADAISRRAQVVVQLSVIDFIHQQAFIPLALHDDQQWLSMGCEAVLSTRYMADLAGVDPRDVLTRITTDNARNPVRAESIDLLHPPDVNSLKPEWIAPYGDAFRVKSARVVSAWFIKSGSSAASLAIVTMRASPPKDGVGLLKLIQTATGADLTEEVKAK